MSIGALVALLPIAACAACLLLMCRPGKNACHTGSGEEKDRLRQEIKGLRAQLESPHAESTRLATDGTAAGSAVAARHPEPR